MIQINKITPQTVEIYQPNNELLGIVNYYEFLDLLVQIKNKQTQGYYIIFNSKKIRIDRNGTLEEYPEGLFDIHINYLSQLI